MSSGTPSPPDHQAPAGGGVEPQPKDPGSRRRKRREKAVAAALAARGAGVERPPPRALLPGTAAPARTADEALAILDEIERSPLGQAWITDEAGNPIVPSTQVTGVVAPLPRRKFLATTARRVAPSMARDLLFAPSWFAVLARLFVWLSGVLRFYAGAMFDTLLRRNTIERRAVRLRRIFEGMGPTFVKLGQQLALRADVIPFAYCEELSKMMDSVPAFPTDYAIKAIERTAKRPITEIFAVFDPSPIGSASLACVYQAIRMSGEKVAVKVRRPNIGVMMVADLKALGWMMKLAEALTVVRPGMTQNLRSELSSMLLEELDFRREARYTEIFQRRARKNRLGYITAPDVHFDLSSDDVLVTEFVSGVFISEILGALDRQDETALKHIKDRGIDPQVLAKRMTKVFNWETLENLLFHSDPHAANIIIRPGNTIVFIDFGSCGRFTERTKRYWRRIHYHLEEEDVAGVVDASIAMMEPLPPIDIHRFTKDLEQLYWDWLYALKSEHAEWWERATGLLWLKLVSTARRYNVGLSLDTLRMFRTIFALDAITYRLWAKLDPTREYWKYKKAAGKRSKKRVLRAVGRRLTRGLTGDDYMRIEELARMTNQIMARVQETLDSPDRHFMQMLGKAAFGVTVMLRLTALALIIHLGALLAVVIYRRITQVPITFADTALAMVSSIPYQVFMALFALLVVRRVLLRVEDVDVDR